MPRKGTFISFIPIILFFTNGLCLSNYSSRREKVDLGLPIVELPWREDISIAVEMKAQASYMDSSNC